MGKWKFLQQEDKTEDKPKERKEETPNKENDKGKEGDATYEQKERQEVKNKIKITPHHGGEETSNCS